MQHKRLILTLLLFFISSISCLAQTTLNTKSDNIIGEYSGIQGGFEFRARITKNSNNTYKAQIYYIKNDRDANGNKYLDEKNPNKNLRNTPCDRVVLFDGMKYNAEKKQWDGAKIYDPQRGIRANAVISFTESGKLKIKGSLMGISETVYWKKI